MATKEENQKRLRELAGLLGREADMSGSAADIAQRVAEWEEEVCASENEIADVDDTVYEQAYRNTSEDAFRYSGTYQASEVFLPVRC